MKTTLPFLLFFFFSSIFTLLYFGNCGSASDSNDGGVYIVYMGAASSSPSTKNSHNVEVVLASLLKSRVVHRYKHGFSGFAARLSESEATQLAKQPGIVSVFRDPILQLHTTRSWDFLQYETSLLIDSRPRSDIAASSRNQGSDIVIGILDTGIWPESESFDDRGMGPIPSRWKGTCMGGPDFNSSNCNRKLIGARYYKHPDSEPTIHTARDALGHGTHVASTAAGVSVPNASYYGLATGTAKGGSPASRIAAYKVCTPSGCPGSAILAAFDDAVADGVDLLSLSLGSSADSAPDFSTDPIAIGSFHAVQKGIIVVCSAGNDGPYEQTVVNVAPWILTVGATSIDRDLESDVVLGNNMVIKGESINFSDLQRSSMIPLVYGGYVRSATAESEDQARKCYPDALDAEKIKGKIVFCLHNDGRYTMKQKQGSMQSNGAVGVVFVNDKTRLVASYSGSFPMTVVSSKDGAKILEYINSTTNPVATILATVTVPNIKPAPIVAYFSGRGPAYTTRNLLKPDIVAPGVSILAAWIANDTKAETTPTGKEPPRFNVLSGTSMACPHVAGIAANIKSQHPDWSPAAIRSAIMTTAIQTNNMKEPITTHIYKDANPYDFGAGEVSPTAGLRPGLIYETNTADHLQFLCYYGYDLPTIKLVSGDLPKGFSCPGDSTTDDMTDLISNINYPSIAVSKDISATPVTVTRTVTNVDDSDDVEESVYGVSVDAPKGVEVKVVPEKLRFMITRGEGVNKKLSYNVTFSTASSDSVKEAVFGAITWTSSKYKVRSPFVVCGDV